MSRKTVSVVSPVYDEEENVAVLVRELTALFAALPYELEIVIADDGSDVATLQVLDRLCAEHPQVGVVQLSRNFGHQAALTAGLDHATGDAVIVMDADLQHPPTVLPEFLAKWEDGYQIVYGVRQDPPAVGRVKHWTSRLFYRMFNLLSETEIAPGVADFRLMDRVAADAMRQMRERTRFLRGLSAWIGFSQIGVPYTAGVRRSGTPKFSLRKMVRLGLDGVISMSTLPLRISIWIGVALSAVSGTYLVYIVWAYFFTNRAIVGWSSLIVAIIFLGGLQINILGIIGLYIAKIYEESKQRPIYLVRSTKGRIARLRAAGSA